MAPSVIAVATSAFIFTISAARRLAVRGPHHRLAHGALADEQREIRRERGGLGLGKEGRQRQRGAAVVAVDHGGQALEQVAFGRRQVEEPLAGVHVRVDEPRRDDEPGGVDARVCRRAAQVADARDAVAADADVGKKPRGAGAVDHAAAGEHEIERLGRLTGGERVGAAGQRGNEASRSSGGGGRRIGTCETIASTGVRSVCTSANVTVTGPVTLVGGEPGGRARPRTTPSGPRRRRRDGRSAVRPRAADRPCSSTRCDTTLSRSVMATMRGSRSVAKP